MPAVARSRLFQALRHLGRVRAHVRFGVGVALGAAAYALAPAGLTAARRAVVAWDAFAGGSLLLWPVIVTADASYTQTVAARESPGAVVSFGLVPLALAGSLAAILLLLSTGIMRTLPPAVRRLHAGLAVGINAGEPSSLGMVSQTR